MLKPCSFCARANFHRSWRISYGKGLLLSISQFLTKLLTWCFCSEQNLRTYNNWWKNYYSKALDSFKESVRSKFKVDYISWNTWIYVRLWNSWISAKILKKLDVGERLLTHKESVSRNEIKTRMRWFQQKVWNVCFR